MVTIGSYGTSVTRHHSAFAPGGLCFAILASITVLGTGSAWAQSSEAKNSSCASSNGETVCLEGSGWLSCTSNNGQTSCEGSGGMRCESDAQGALTCVPPEGGRCETRGDSIVCMKAEGSDQTEQPT